MSISKEVLDLLKSGNFTLAYHDSDNCTLHKGRMSYDKLPTDEDGCLEGEIATWGGTIEGYASEEVVALVKALGGKVVSI